MPSLSERIAALPQFQGRDWSTIDPAEIQAQLSRLLAEDQAAYAASKRRWGYADKAAMAATLTLLGTGLTSPLWAGTGAASASVPGAVGSNVAPLGGGTVTAGAGTGIGTAAGVGAGAGGAAINAAMNGAGNVLGMSPKDWAALVAGLTGTIGGAITGRNSRNTLQPNTTTSDPNLARLLATMQGRLDKSEPLYDSIMAMANGLLPTQYQRGSASGAVAPPSANTFPSNVSVDDQLTREQPSITRRG